ncbi:hypothetical protein EVAR_17473_1 [Eumeta japonica]|uniref:Uncharacterized protein n=1 Tax=Eumeta variegata TaxID=151549 RepID=A0A4C1SGQ3_EUMVA|nr:hypothetical protein EVAR_17473_1 [Eumeta japonica]
MIGRYNPQHANEVFLKKMKEFNAHSLLLLQEDKFIIKLEVEEDEVIAKRELDIGPAVLTPRTVPHPPPPPAQAGPSPRLNSNFVGGVPSALLNTSEFVACHPAHQTHSILLTLVLVQPATRTYVEKDYCRGDRGAPSYGNLQLDVKRTNNIYQSVPKMQTRDHSDSEDLPMSTNEEGQCRYSVELEAERNPIPSLLKHMKNDTRTSMDVKRYKCQQCEYTAARPRSLKVRSGRRPHGAQGHGTYGADIQGCHYDIST